MRNPRILAACFLATFVIASLSAVQSVQAKKVGPAASGAAIEACMLSDDHRMLENATHFACCSRDAGICVICPKPPNANSSCNVVDYRASPIPAPRAITPDTLNGVNMLNN